jgi:hypothetical protein
MSPELCYATGIILAAIMGGVMANSFAKEHGWRKILPLAIVLSLGTGIAIGWALTGEFNLISISSGGTPNQ